MTSVRRDIVSHILMALSVVAGLAAIGTLTLRALPPESFEYLWYRLTGTTISCARTEVAASTRTVRTALEGVLVVFAWLSGWWFSLPHRVGRRGLRARIAAARVWLTGSLLAFGSAVFVNGRVSGGLEIEGLATMACLAAVAAHLWSRARQPLDPRRP